MKNTDYKNELPLEYSDAKYEKISNYLDNMLITENGMLSINKEARNQVKNIVHAGKDWEFKAKMEKTLEHLKENKLNFSLHIDAFYEAIMKFRNTSRKLNDQIRLSSKIIFDTIALHNWNPTISL